MPTHVRRAPSFEEMTFTEPRTVLFAVGDKDSVETKLSWRWCRDNLLQCFRDPVLLSGLQFPGW